MRNRVNWRVRMDGPFLVDSLAGSTPKNGRFPWTGVQWSSSIDIGQSLFPRIGGTPMYRLALCLPSCLLVSDRVDLQSVSTVLATAADQEPLPAPDPVSFLSKCLERYDS